jgi:hypothetical protein
VQAPSIGPALLGPTAGTFHYPALRGQIGLVAADQTQGGGFCAHILTRGEELCVDPGLKLLDRPEGRGQVGDLGSKAADLRGREHAQALELGRRFGTERPTRFALDRRLAKAVPCPLELRRETRMLGREDVKVDGEIDRSHPRLR